jgi:hypothetical protein
MLGRQFIHPLNEQPSIALRFEHHAGYRTPVGPKVGRAKIAMKFAGDGAHRHPVERHAITWFTRHRTFALRLRDHRERQRIDEASQAIWVEDRNRRTRMTPHSTGETPWHDCSGGSNRGLANKFAASSQLSISTARIILFANDAAFRGRHLNFVGSTAHVSPNTKPAVDEHLSSLGTIPTNDRGRWATIIQEENPALPDRRTPDPEFSSTGTSAKDVGEQTSFSSFPTYFHRNKSLRSFVFSSAAAPSRGLTPKISSIVFRVELWS